jgi:hypothetical protein
MTDLPDDGRPLETREDPADAHARTLAELVAAETARKHNQTASVFGFDLDAQQERTSDDAA